MTEEWRDIPGWWGSYQVSNLGQVRSMPRKYRKNILVLKPGINGGGYKIVVLTSPAGSRETRTVHSLVARAFIGPRPHGLEVCHNDGNRLNNTFSNLRYDTRENNNKDKIKHGTSLSGEKNPKSALTLEQVNEIRDKLKDAYRGIQSDLAAEYGITRQAVSLIAKGKTWK